ncbi:glycosyltransferase family 24 protein [Serpula lacrymans var. lacrymans S7.9]|uniref:Glycosyltransferase family 24 protein n=1 Tax=Serpula lacrymans var. lacrymans (strain S7.9) TaxID=578457 RepID=F8NH08_SERL9|nr:glycosyltransferase family 24 protein [Serpula lacrymans var. lacrymans S7.9]EGO29865.1 glycosyltransferase family 24 protein [Serpula lacrymans var. lacrymans S7.9]
MHYFLALALALFPFANASPPVSVQLRTPWLSPGPLLETIETISIEDPSAFFPLLSLLSTNPPDPNASPKTVHAHVLDLASPLLDGPARASVDALLVLHAASPRIAAFEQHFLARTHEQAVEDASGETCAAWVDWYGHVVCTVDGLKRAVSSISFEHKPQPRSLPFDHVYPSPHSQKPTAIFYASLTAPNFPALHHALVDLTQSAGIEYVLRWAVSPDPQSTRAHDKDALGASLSGYGVSLDLKKMDYLALDDRGRSASTGQASPDSTAHAREQDQDALLALFDSLPSLNASTELHIEGGTKDAALSEDEIADLGLRATQLIYSYSSPSKREDDKSHENSVTASLSPLTLLRQLTHSFPLYATKLARKDLLDGLDSSYSLPSDKGTEKNEEHDAWAGHQPTGVLSPLFDSVRSNWEKVAPGTSLFWVNGRVLGEGEVGVFGLIRTLRKERSLVRALMQLGMSTREAVEVVVHDAHSRTGADGDYADKDITRRGKGVKKGSEVEEEREEEKGGSRSGRWNAKHSKLDPRPEDASKASSPVHSSHDDVAKSTSKKSNKDGGVHRPKFPDALVPTEATEGLVDASDRTEGGGVVVWWNDLGADARYARYSSSLSVLLRPLYPGQLPMTRFNLFNAILVLDLAQPRTLSFLAMSLEGIVARGWAVRWGIVPFVEWKEGEGVDGTKMARLFYFVSEKYGRDVIIGFLKRVSAAHVQTPTLSWPLVRMAWADFGMPDDFDSVVEGRVVASVGDEAEKDGGNVDTLHKARLYARRVGITDASGHAFVNGRYIGMSDAFLRDLQVEVTQQLQYLQELVYTSILTDSYVPTISTFFYDLPWTPARRNAHIYPLISSPASGGVQPAGSSARPLRMFSLPELPKVVGKGGFVTPQDDDYLPISMYVIADFDSESGLALVKEALDFILISKDVLATISPARLKRALGLDEAGSVSTPDESAQVALKADLLREYGVDGGEVVVAEDAYAGYVGSCKALARELRLLPGEQAILVNGRLVGPFDASEFMVEDFEMLETYEMRKRVGSVVVALEDVLGEKADDLDSSSYAHLVSTSSSLISAIQLPDPSEAGLFDTAPKPRSRKYKLLDGNYTSFEIGNADDALYHVAAVVDPLSETAQKWTSLLEWLVEFPGVYLELYLNPSQHSEIPLKRFYRYNLAPRLTYDENGLEVPAKVVFNGLPIEPIYTLGMDVPSSWLVRPREALYDLDNIQLGSLSPQDRVTGLEAVFALDYLVVEGHARETLLNSPPRGLQLQLSTPDGTPVDDTQVVANLGYLQFKAKPGVYELSIREGRGRDVFEMESVGNEGWESPRVEEVGSEVTVMSFEGLTLYPRLVRKPGMEMVDVLDELSYKEEETHGVIEDIVSRMTSLFSHKGEKSLQAQGDGQADINIFTVASGLLYERFVSIMILSVLRNTNKTVKFWFIENFLSPSFLEFIPHLAEAYNFQYELVTYKWPSWLRAQKEKQRIIWAYKILFLDVLFPMDLKKVIFVDADQIVRADLQELVDLDLHGAPYGYTPMGDDNYDMEGFRFWKTGYWADFLRGRPYHISALYVVDLVRFRQIAAGDILRGQYQALSADPNSLANLDQDLPNNIQQQVPIFSLHEDWLWCETWCSKDRLHRAKTIDLCQNPLTKEPKLARARQIPEWEEYDAEIARFARKLAEEGKIRASAATADTNVLANVGATPQAAESVGDNSEEARPRDEL